MKFGLRLFLITAALLTGCSKDSPTTDTGDCVPSGLFADVDGDGFGNPNAPICAGGKGVEIATDCDDTLATIHPDATEKCGTDFDDNCDGEVNGPDAEGCTVFFADLDSDGFGASDQSACLCEATGDYTALVGNDCDDGLPTVHPDAMEDCATEYDDNCDQVTNTENATNCRLFYVDQDNDGAGGADSACYCEATTHYLATTQDDCDDSRASAYPGAVEFCNGIQEDCNISNWEASAEDGFVSFEDEDSIWSDKTQEITGSLTISDAGTWHFCEGEYSVNLVISGMQGVSLRGRGDAEDILINGVNGLALQIENSKVEVESLSLQGSQSNGEGGAIYLNAPDLFLAPGNVHLSLLDTIVLNSEAKTGAGLFIKNAEVLIVDSSIYGNNAARAAGLCLFKSTLTLENTVVYNNTASQIAGGLGVFDDSVLALFDTRVHSNESGGWGGGISMDESSLTLTDSNVNGNTSASTGGGIYADESTVSCTATTNGTAGIYGNSRSLSGRNNGYGVALTSGSTLTGTNCDMGHVSTQSKKPNYPAAICLFPNTATNCTSVNFGNSATYACVVGSMAGACQ